MYEELSASMEDYLRVIYEIIEEQGAVRAKDIAERLGVSNPSVTGALRSLEKRNLIHYAPYGVITLTPAGERTGKNLENARNIMQDFLLNVLALDEEQAKDTACKLEHVISREIMDRFAKFFEYVKDCPRGGIAWERGRGFHCEMRGKCCDQEESKGTVKPAAKATADRAVTN